VKGVTTTWKEDLTKTEKCTMQLVLSVVRDAKSHSNQLKVRMYYVATVSKLIDLQEEILVEALADETADETTLTENHEKCTKQLVHNVTRLAKCHSNQHQVRMSYVATVSKLTEINF
jgi:hypothetical protein